MAENKQKEVKKDEERKCFGLKEKSVLKFVIPCAASFIGCLLALAVYSSLAGKPPVPCNCPPPPCSRMEAPRHGEPQFAGEHKQFRGDKMRKPGVNRPDRPEFDGPKKPDRPHGQDVKNLSDKKVPVKE